MNLKKAAAIILFFAASTTSAHIQNIFIDINAIIDTSQMASAKYVGWKNSLSCLAKYNPTDPIKKKYAKIAIVFDGLRNVPAQSQQTAYKSHLEIPLILSDWLLGLQSNQEILKAVKAHLVSNNFSSSELNFFTDVISMMTTPHKLINTQYVMKKSAKFIKKLHATGKYKIYITGNWDPESVTHLKQLLSKSISPYVDGIHFTYGSHYLKPHVEAFKDILRHYNLTADTSLAIEVEETSVKAAQACKLDTILLDVNNIKVIDKQLAQHGINLG